MSGIVGAGVAALCLAVVNASGLTLTIKGDPPPVECATRARESHEEQVTVRVWDRRGRESHGGSGAVIGRRNGVALILTCYHTHRGGGRDIVIRGHGYQSPGRLVAADPSRDLAMITARAAPGMPVARIAVREMSPGDSVRLSGFGGGSRGLLVRDGRARSNRHVGARTDFGDSGGPAFVNSKVVGVVVTNTSPGSQYGTTGVVPLRDVYAMANTIRASERGASVYQRAGDEVLCGLFPAVGRILFANRAKRMRKGPWADGGCGPGGCSPGGGGTPSEPNDGEPWYAPGFGPDSGSPNGDRPAPDPTPQPDEPTVDIDLSGLVQRPEFDALAGRFDALATKADIEIVIGRVGQVEDVIAQTASAIGAIDSRLVEVEAVAAEPPEPKAPPEPKRHWVVVADWSSASWPALLKQIEATRAESGAAIDTVDSRRINGVVGAPQIIGYVNGVPSQPIGGDRPVSEKLFEIARGAE